MLLIPDCRKRYTNQLCCPKHTAGAEAGIHCGTDLLQPGKALAQGKDGIHERTATYERKGRCLHLPLR